LLQHLLCNQLEETREKALDHDIKSLLSITIRGEDMPDPRLAAWVECDKISRTFAYDYPNGFCIPSCEEYSELFADYLGMHRPLAARLRVGTPLHSARANLRRPPTVDAWGFALSCLFAEGVHQSSRLFHRVTGSTGQSVLHRYRYPVPAGTAR
jgi:hypothetical protein